MYTAVGVFIGIYAIYHRNENRREKKKQNVKAEKVAKCFNCNTIKSQNYFSKNQWKRRDTFARCKQCTGTKIHNFRNSNNMKKDNKITAEVHSMNEYQKKIMHDNHDFLKVGKQLESDLRGDTKNCGGPIQNYWGRRSGKLRTRNWGFSQHIDAVWNMKCFKKLIELDVFPDAKDISESMGALRACTLYSHLDTNEIKKTTTSSKKKKNLHRSRWKQPNVWCICIGDGSTPRTATLISFLTDWNIISIDPGLKPEFVGKMPKGIHRLECFDKKFEDWVNIASTTCDNKEIKKNQCQYLYIICVHSHHRFVGDARFDKVRNIFGNCKTCLVNLPCCNRYRPTKDIGRTPDLTFEDPAIFSAMRKIEVWLY